MSKLHILQRNDKFTPLEGAVIIDELPMGVYTVEQSMFGYDLKKSSDFKMPDIVYGTDKSFINHVVRTWNSCGEESFGIGLIGGKGLGKSFTAFVICNEIKVPIIQIKNSYRSDVLAFLSSIQQPHIVVIDEFDKLYPNQDSNARDLDDDRSKENAQEMFLSYLDGIEKGGAKRLFILTSNNNINEYLLNRPSRLRYIKNYKGVPLDVIKEIVNSRLINKEFIPDLLSNLDDSGLNIDILCKIIDEINLHNAPYSSFKDFFNFTPDDVYYDIYIGDEKILLSSSDSDRVRRELKEFGAYGFCEPDCLLHAPNKLICLHSIQEVSANGEITVNISMINEEDYLTLDGYRRTTEMHKDVRVKTPVKATIAKSDSRVKSIVV